MQILSTCLGALLASAVSAAPQQDIKLDMGSFTHGVKVRPWKTTTTTTSTPPVPTLFEYKSCGGFRIQPVSCPTGYECIDDPRKPGCGMACDIPGICVKDAEFCGGFAGVRCPRGKQCYDVPNDACDPKSGGADCGGICLWPN